MLRIAMAAAAAALLLGASGVAAATPTATPAATPVTTPATTPVTTPAATAATVPDTSRDTYVAHVASQGVDGKLNVVLEHGPTRGSTMWTLDGLGDGNVTIRMHGGTCADPTDLVGTVWTHDAVFPDGTGSRTIALPAEFAEAFAADIANHHGVTATVHNNDHLIGCVPFTDKV